LIGLTGAKGTGKTTMLLQHIKRTFLEKQNSALAVWVAVLIYKT